MSRVSENSSIHAINYAVGKTKSKLENLQLKGSNLKRVQKPSDDPVGNVELLSIRSQKVDSEQYLRNNSMAKAQLAYTENAVEELTDLVSKAKELAIGQASNFFTADVRQSVAKEVNQLRQQAISIANRRMGNKYIFSGHKSLTKPFTNDGEYHGDSNQTKLEVSKDFFVPINFSGDIVFFEKDGTSLEDNLPLKNTPFEQLEKTHRIDNQGQLATPEPQIRRDLASVQEPMPMSKNLARTTVFDDLQKLENALLSDNHEIIQSLLPKFDEGLNRLIEVRTKIGSVVNSLENAENNIEKTTLLNEEYKSKIEDADIAELFTDLTRQKSVLDATYKASAQLMNKSLINFIN